MNKENLTKITALLVHVAKVDENYSEKEKLNQINSIFTKDIAYKNISLGFIVGHFSIQECDLYFKYSSEIHKRIIKIIQQRIQDSIPEL